MRKPCKECNSCKKPELKNRCCEHSINLSYSKLRCSLRRCTQMKEFGETKEAGAEYSQLDGKNEIEKAKGKGSSGKEAKTREESRKEKKVEDKNARVGGKKSDGTNSDVRRSDGKRCEFKEGVDNKRGAIDKAKILKLLNDDLDCSSDTSSEEGQCCSTSHGDKGKSETSKKMKNKLKAVPSKVFGWKDVQLKESKKKHLKQDGYGQHSSSSSRTNNSSMSGSKGRESEVLNETIYQSKLDHTE